MTELFKFFKLFFYSEVEAGSRAGRTPSFQLCEWQKFNLATYSLSKNYVSSNGVG